MSLLTYLTDKFIVKPLANSMWLTTFSFGSQSFKIASKPKMLSAYEDNMIVFQVVDKQASVVSSLPYIFTRLDGTQAEAPRESAVWERPNPDQSGKELRYQIITDLLVFGEAFVYKLKPVGGARVAEFHVLPSASTSVNRNARNEVISIDTVLFGSSRTLRDEELDNVLRIKMQGIKGDGSAKPKLSAMGEAVSSSSSMLETEAFTFKNRGVSKLLSNESDMPMTPDEKKELNAEFQRATAGAGNAGKAYLTNAKLKAIDLFQSPSDLKIDEGVLGKLRLIAGMYGLDSKIFGDPKASTYNNMREATEAAYLQVYIPLAEDFIVKAFNAFWLEKENSQVRLYLDLDAIDSIKSANKEFADAEEVRARTVDTVLKMQATRNVKQAMLISLGYSEDTAQELTEQVGGDAMDALRSLPPLIASKIIDRLPPEELIKLLK